VQSVGHIPIDVVAMHVDLLSLSGHKLYGPKGVGALYMRRGVRVKPQMLGGGHERGLRSGTENVPGIVGLGRAAELALAEMDTEAIRQAALRDRLLDGLTAAIPESQITGHRTKRLPNNASIIARYVEGEAMLLRLDAQGIAASSGSACTSGSLDPSHVLLAMGIPVAFAHGSLRFSLGRGTTEAEIDRVIAVLPGIVETLRAMSPFKPGMDIDAMCCADGHCH
jgi:cysteine desulfurase